MPVLFLLSGPNMGFFATCCLDKCEIWHRGLWSAPRAKFHIYRGRNVGIDPPKLSKFQILAINLTLRDDLFALFLRNSQHLYAFIGSF